MPTPFFSYYYITSTPIRLTCDTCKSQFTATVITAPIPEKFFCSAKCLFAKMPKEHPDQPLLKRELDEPEDTKPSFEVEK